MEIIEYKLKYMHDNVTLPAHDTMRDASHEVRWRDGLSRDGMANDHTSK
jgi:hypothetical protein